MSFSAIWKETGRATLDEIRRVRQRLEILERYRGSLENALVAPGSSRGPVGTGNLFLRLDAANDPLTGNVQGLHSRWTRVGIGVDPSYPLHMDVTAGKPAIFCKNDAPDVVTLDPQDASLPDILWSLRAQDITYAGDGDTITTLSLSGTAASDEFTDQGGALKWYAADSEVNGKPTLKFTGADGYFEQGTGLNLTGAFTFICVHRLAETDAGFQRAILGNSGGTHKESLRVFGGKVGQGFETIWADDQWYLANPASSEWNSTTLSATWSVGVITRDGAGQLAGWNALKNKALVDYGDGSQTTDAIDVNLLWRDENTGGSETAEIGMGVAEWYIYDGKLTDEQINQVYNHLAERYTFPTVGSGQGNFIECYDGDDTKVFHVENDGKIVGAGALSIAGSAAIVGLLAAGSAEISGVSTFSGAATFNSTVQVSDDLTMPDNVELRMGTGLDFRMFYDPTIGLRMQQRRGGEPDSMRIEDAVGNDYVEINGANCNITIVGAQPSLILSERDVTLSNWSLFSAATTLRLLDPNASQIMQWDVNNSAGAFKFFSDSLLFDNDNAGVKFGEAQDAEITYDGTDLVLNPKLVGSGAVRIAGNLVVSDSHIEVDEIATPSTPGADIGRIFLNSIDGELSIVKDSGSVVSLESGGGGGGGDWADLVVSSAMVQVREEILDTDMTVTTTLMTITIPAGYDEIYLELYSAFDFGSPTWGDVEFRMNGDATAGNYHFQNFQITDAVYVDEEGSNLIHRRGSVGDLSPAKAYLRAWIDEPDNATRDKVARVESGSVVQDDQLVQSRSIIVRENSAALTSLVLTMNTVPFVPGTTLRVYGKKNQTVVTGVTGGAALRNVISFGDSALGASAYIKLPGSQVAGSAAAGVRQLRPGSITGVSIQAIGGVVSTPGTVGCEVRKNGTPVLTVTMSVDGSGLGGTHGTTDSGLVTFTAGDLLALYANFDGTISGANFNTEALLEIQSET